MKEKPKYITVQKDTKKKTINLQCDFRWNLKKTRYVGTTQLPPSKKWQKDYEVLEK